MGERSMLCSMSVNGDAATFTICDNRQCNAGLQHLAYSRYHIQKLGWVRRELPPAEAEAFGRDYIILCPECAKE